METLQRLLDRAFERAPAPEANERINAIRDRLGRQAPARSYEVTAPAAAGLSWFEQAMMPRLVYYLESVGASPPEASGLFVSLFAGSELYFLHVRDIFAFATEALGISTEQMLERWGTGERPERPQARSSPLMLPGSQDPR